jgi:retron-type reverse transcriptase
LQGAPKYFLDADIKGCFDNIDHEYLLGKFNTLKMFKAQIKSWLNLGIIDSKEEFSCETNEVGIPQGGVISPLLMVEIRLKSSIMQMTLLSSAEHYKMSRKQKC